MPKIIELTVELEVQKVSCPGVWLCQDGRVSLTVFALGTSYQTCLLPPIFPLLFRDVFYFRKRFQESCTLNNICCILKEETIYCELVQWCNDCTLSECTVLAQYLGAINDVLFPPNMCSNDGVDLLMRRSKEFPGILSPKIEIATKVRIDEVWDEPCNMKALKATSCHCAPHDDAARQRTVCHTSQYHRNKCNQKPSWSGAGRGSRSRSRSDSRSCCSLEPERPSRVSCQCPPAPKKPRASRWSSGARRRRQYDVYTVDAPSAWPDFLSDTSQDGRRSNAGSDKEKSRPVLPQSDNIQKLLLESRYISHEHIDTKLKERERHKHIRSKITPCVCEICRRYHDLFHAKS